MLRAIVLMLALLRRTVVILLVAVLHGEHLLCAESDCRSACGSAQDSQSFAPAHLILLLRWAFVKCRLWHVTDGNELGCDAE